MGYDYGVCTYMSSSTAKTRYDVLNDFFAYKMLDVHTQVPATVTAVGTRTVDCQPMVKTKYTDGSQLDYSELYDVPLLVLSANKGKTAIKMPVKVGDIVLVFFSEREVGSFDSSQGESSDAESLQTHGIYPIGAFPCIFSSAVGDDIHPDDIVIQNETTTIVIEPNGKIEATTSTDYIVNCERMTVNTTDFTINTTNYVVNSSSSEFNSDSDFTLNTPSYQANSSTYSLNSEVSVNGGFSSSGGGFTHEGTDVGSTHTHGGVQTGPGNTGTPN